MGTEKAHGGLGGSQAALRMLFFLKYGQRGKTTVAASCYQCPCSRLSLPPSQGISKMRAEPHTTVPLKTCSGMGMNPGGARKDLSYFSDLPQKNVSHFQAFLQKKKKKRQAFVTIQRDRVPSFSEKEGSCAQYPHCHDQQEGMVFWCSTHVQTGFSY